MIKFPEHKCGLYLEHNPHKNVYETIEQYTSMYKNTDWISLEEKKKAIETNELWRIQWYPDTPVGFYILLSSSLEILLEAANKVK